MKKLLLGLGTLAATVAPITTIVACGTTSNTGGAIETPTTPDNGNQATIESVFATEFEKEYTGQTYDPSSTVATYLNIAQKENPEFYKDIPAIKAVLFWSDDAKVKSIMQSDKKTNDYTLHQKLYDQLRKIVLGETNVKEIATQEFGALKGSFPLYLSKVVSIDAGAFQSSPLTSLSLPLVTSIGDNAFQSSKLTSLILPLAALIGNSAFLSSLLTSLSLPLVTSIGNGAFSGSILTSLNLPKVTSIDVGAFTNSPLTSLNLPLVTSIATGAFLSSLLTSLNFPLVASIANGAFMSSPLTSLSLPLVTLIGITCWDHSSVPVPTNVDSSHPGFFAFPGNNDATKDEYDEYIKNNPIESNDSPEESV